VGCVRCPSPGWKGWAEADTVPGDEKNWDGLRFVGTKLQPLAELEHQGGVKASKKQRLGLSCRST